MVTLPSNKSNKTFSFDNWYKVANPKIIAIATAIKSMCALAMGLLMKVLTVALLATPPDLPQVWKAVWYSFFAGVAYITADLLEKLSAGKDVIEIKLIKDEKPADNTEPPTEIS